MDSSNIHYKSHLQNHQLICSSDSYNYAAAAAGNNPHVWTPNSFLSSDVSITSDEALNNLRNPRLLQNDNIVTSLNNNPSIMSTKDFGLELCAPTGINFIEEEDHNLQLNNNSHIKQEVLYQNYGRFFINPSSRIEDNMKIKNVCYSNYVKDLKEGDDHELTCTGENINGNNNYGNELSLEECSSCLLNSPGTVTSSSSRSRSRSKQSCSQIYPTINVSEMLMNQQLPGGGSMGINSSSCNNFGLNFQGLDLFNSSRFGGNFHQQQPLIQEDLEFSKNSCLPYGMDFMKQSIGNTFETTCNMEFPNKRVAELKKHDVNSETKTGKTQIGTKRSRSIETKCQPLKVFQVRKEKLGDRIAALQQLVAPFGKTDTASVLMEAIGYIKFLHNQVQTLCVPYLKSSRHKNNRAAQHGDYVDSKNEELRQNLKSKGLCLVPLSCLSYVSDGGGGPMWPPPHFG